jgi:hypothetical protein
VTFNVPALRIAVARVRAATDRPIFIAGHATQWSAARRHRARGDAMRHAELVARLDATADRLNARVLGEMYADPFWHARFAAWLAA